MCLLSAFASVGLRTCGGVVRDTPVPRPSVSDMSGTLSDMTEEIERERFTLRFTTRTLVELRELAAVETEGNVSFMVRKLVDEALTARRSRTVRT